MKSTIRVEFDYQKREPYLKIFMANLEPEGNDLKDGMLQFLIGTANNTPLLLCPAAEPVSTNGMIYELRPVNESSNLEDHKHLSQIFHNWAMRYFFPEKTSGSENKRKFNEFFDVIYKQIAPHLMSKNFVPNEEFKYPLTMVCDYLENLPQEQRMLAFDAVRENNVDIKAKASDLSDAISQVFNGKKIGHLKYWPDVCKYFRIEDTVNEVSEKQKPIDKGLENALMAILDSVPRSDKGVVYDMSKSEILIAMHEAYNLGVTATLPLANSLPQ